MFGADNNWAKGYHTKGTKLIDAVNCDVFRKETKKTLFAGQPKQDRRGNNFDL